MVELGIVEPVEQVNGARARGGQADADLAGELGVGARREGGDLLVANLDELEVSPTSWKPPMMPLMPSPG
jgi:hypothetical protein